MKNLTEIKKVNKSEKKIEDNSVLLDKIYNEKLQSMLKRCYQCARCTGVCQQNFVQKFNPSRIIQMILEGFESKIIESGVLWDCLMCNTCLQNCPQDINFAEVVRTAKYKMQKLKNQNPEEYVAHKGVYTTISEIMSKPGIHPNRSLEWVPKGVDISESGNTLYFVGCIPYFNFEFENIDPIASNALNIIHQIENEPIVVFKDEICCGHDLYWGQGKFNAFINLAKKNLKMFEDAGVSTIITACAECYRTFKVDYQELFEDFNEKFEVKHIIEYIYDKWKDNKIEFRNPDKNIKKIQYTFHDPCRLSRFLPKSNNILEKTREIFNQLKEFGYEFREMEHNKENSLCCGVSSWMNCNERSKALRYKRLLEAKSVASIMLTSCPKCKIHQTCLQDDIEEISHIKIMDFAEFLANFIKIKDGDKDLEEKN